MTQIQPFEDYDDVTFDGVEQESGHIQETTFTDCIFKNCQLRETEFTNCRFNDCSFEACDLSLITVRDCSFREVEFIDSKVVGVNWISAEWPRITSGSPINFKDCVIDYSTFIGLTLTKIRFNGCTAKDVEFSDANLTSADFRDTTLTASRFNNSNLTKANFEGAKEYTIDMGLNILKQARFTVPEAYSLLHSTTDLILVDV